MENKLISMEKKLIRDSVKMKSLLRWFFEYIEKDEALTSFADETIYTFPNVVISMTENEIKEMKKIIRF